MNTTSSNKSQKIEIWSLISLEVLFGLCALSVVAYKLMGKFDFGFGSYRFFNIVLSVLFIGYLIYGLLRSQKQTLILVILFSLFHLIEGVLISFWYKTVIHLMILIVVAYYYLRHKTILLR